MRPVSEFVPLMNSLFLFHLSPGQLLADLYKAYKDARRHKRKRFYQLQFELDFEFELVSLRDELLTRTYIPSASTCFIINEPKKREVFAAEFRDRIVHHLYYNYASPLFERLFIADSYSCRKNKGTHYGIKRLQHHIRSVSENYARRCYVMRIDILGYFMHISRDRLLDICLKNLVKMARRESDVAGKTWCEKLDYELLFYLSDVIIRNNPLENCKMKGAASDWRGLPRSKSLFHSDEGCGLPIGNLTSQLFSNVYMNEFDCFVKRSFPQFAYGRYVDDAFFVSPSKSALRDIIPLLNAFLSSSLNLELHKNKLFIMDIRYGVEFLGGFSKPYRCYMANRSLARVRGKIYALNNVKDVFLLRASINSFLGILSHYATFRIRKELFAHLECANRCGVFNRRFMKFKLSRVTRS